MNQSNTYRRAILVVAQSLAIHPDWNLETHLAYLESEVYVNVDEMISVATPRGPLSFPLRTLVGNWIKFPKRTLELVHNHIVENENFS
jgi:hypothetical protein